jgi:predicted O-methyltransferase YrrM
LDLAVVRDRFIVPFIAQTSEQTPVSLKRRLRSILYPDCGPAAVWDALPRAEAPLPDSVEEVLPDDSTGYPISRPVARLLAHLILSGGARNVLELGAGSSSIVIAKALSLAGGGRLTSIEQAPEWCQEAWGTVTRTPGIDAHMEVALPAFRVLRSGPTHLYATAHRIVQVRGPYDLVLVDAPQAYYGRDGALPLAWEALRPGALVVVDDAGRPQERWAIRRWLQTYTGLTLAGYDPGFGRNGVAVLRVGRLAQRPSARAWISGAVHAGVGWLRRRVRRLDANRWDS